jgi:hypothetical protein
VLGQLPWSARDRGVATRWRRRETPRRVMITAGSYPAQKGVPVQLAVHARCRDVARHRPPACRCRPPGNRDHAGANPSRCVPAEREPRPRRPPGNRRRAARPPRSKRGPACGYDLRSHAGYSTAKPRPCEMSACGTTAIACCIRCGKQVLAVATLQPPSSAASDNPLSTSGRVSPATAAGRCSAIRPNADSASRSVMGLARRAT